MAESKERWPEQGTKSDQLVLQMETISTQFQQFIASQPARKDIGTSSRGILTTPGTDKKKQECLFQPRESLQDTGINSEAKK